MSLLLLGCGSFPLVASEASFLLLSDLHFSPLAEPSVRAQLPAADVQSWESILSRASSQTLSKPGEDTNWPLLRSVLNRASTLPGKPKFVLITGDLFAHHLREEFERSDVPQADFAAFAQKIIQFLAQEFKAALPRVPVFMALGNNDGDCDNGDYSIEPGGGFLRKTLPAMAAAAGVTPINLEDGWLDFGSYDVAHPTLKKSRIIVLNTTLFSWRYQNSCGDKSDDPGMRMLTWLQNRLSAAKTQSQKVWLVYHIPPGIDAYATTHPRTPTAERIVTMWNPRYQAEFEKILLQHRDTVQNQFAGHTHFDDFRLLGNSAAPSAFVLLTPGVSPNVRQNPAIREAKFSSGGTLTDFETWYLPLLDETRDWKLGYKFRREWKLKAVDVPNLSTLHSQILKSSKVKSQWEEVYSVQSLNNKGMTKRDFAATFCASGNAHSEDFRKCFCEMSNEAAFCRQ